jgi:UDP-N-acetylmuramate--alanine ligase
MEKNIKHIHFIGVGGAGMNGLAEVFLNMGYKISGSDIKSSENTERIKKLGGKIFIGHNEKNIKNADIVVYSNAVPDTNPEIIAAKKMRIPVIPRAAMLNEVLRFKTGIAIAGSHGKTTTTSMVAHIFEVAKKSPTYIVGGVVKTGGVHAKAGKGKYVIVEACEAYGSFLYLDPVIAAVTNIDNDHLDYYKNMDNLKEAFKNFINRIPFYGVAYLNGDDINIKSISNDILRKKIFFGFNKENDIYAKNIKIKGFIQLFDVIYDKKKLGRFELEIPGRHNILNALVAIAISYDLGIKVDKIKSALKSFRNVKRRFNIHNINGYTIIDDYAHHPSEIEKVLITGREIARKNQRIITIFQPHLFTRTQLLYKEFAEALSLSDFVILDKIYPAREVPIPSVSSKLIYDYMKELKFNNVFYFTDWLEIIDKLKTIITKKDIVFILGAGNIIEILDLMKRELK